MRTCPRSAIGNTNRATESRHATGAEAEIPDISEYSRGRKGYFQIWDPQAKEITARGRTFLLGVPPDELAYCKRIVDARTGTRRTLPAIEVAPRDRQEHAPEAAVPGANEMRARLAAARERNETASTATRPAPAPVATPAATTPQAVPGVPAEATAVLMRLLASPEGTTASEAGAVLGKSKETTREYLAVLRDRELAELTGGGRGSRWRLIRTEPAAGDVSKITNDHEDADLGDPGPQYTTLVELAESVHDGGTPVTDEQRAVLEQVWQITHRPRLTVIQGGGGDAP